MYGLPGVGEGVGNGVLVGVLVGTGVKVGEGVAVGGAPTTMVVSLLVMSLVCCASRTWPILAVTSAGLRIIVPKPGQAWPLNGPPKTPLPKVAPVDRLIIVTLMPTSPVTNTKLVPAIAPPSNSMSQRGVGVNVGVCVGVEVGPGVGVLDGVGDGVGDGVTPGVGRGGKLGGKAAPSLPLPPN